jgi:pimeloyl-ACP methyl ester carboxylesterase/DNA-binding CsgD family transcriptional regulator
MSKPQKIMQGRQEYQFSDFSSDGPLRQTSANSTNEEILELVGSVYQSILKPESFVDVLEIWDRNISSRENIPQDFLELLERQLSTAIPLLESALRDVVNQDELVSRLAEYDRASILVSNNNVVVGINSFGQERFGLVEGDRLAENLMSKESRSQFEEIQRHARSKNSDDVFRILTLTTMNAEGRPVDHLVAARVARVNNADQGFILISNMELVLSNAGKNAFKSAFGLTDGEMNIVSELVSGLRQTDMAKKLGIREDTIKKHIRNVRDKTGSANTTALVCLAASFAQISSEQTASPEWARPAPRSITNSSNQTYTMASRNKLANVNGLQVEYVDHGDCDGPVIVILHSSMIGFLLPPEFIADMTSRGYRLVMPYRPGTGMSDQLPGDFSLEETASHMLAFTRVLGIDQFILLGGTVGFIYACAMAGLEPQRVRSLIGIAGYLPIDPEVLRKGMARYQRGVLYTLQKNRSLAKFLVLSGYKMFLQLGAHGFMSQIMRQSKEDLRVLNDANAIGVMSVGLRIAGAQGVDALLNNSSLVLSDWKHLADKVKCPITLFHGTDDSVFKLPMIEEFCAANPRFDLKIIENSGQLLVYDNPIRLSERIDLVVRQTG